MLMRHKAISTLPSYLRTLPRDRNPTDSVDFGKARGRMVDGEEEYMYDRSEPLARQYRGRQWPLKRPQEMPRIAQREDHRRSEGTHH